MTSQTRASSTDLSQEAAHLADTNLFIRARFIEAAETMAHLQVHGVWPSDKSGIWPGVADIVDGDYLERYRPNAAAISRAEEAMQGWLLDHVADPEKRILIARWSVCLACPRIVGSFRSWCHETGRVRRTAERRVDAAFQSIARALLKNAQSLREPNWSRVSPLLPEWGRDIDMVAERVREHGPKHWRADDAVPVHMPETHEAVKAKRAA